MKKKLVISLVLLSGMLFHLSSYAKDVQVMVTGMVCGTCAEKIEKKLLEKGQVKRVDVDVESGQVLVTLKKGKALSSQSIRDLIKEAGFKVLSVKR
jgi:copper chaperone CopZ